MHSKERLENVLKYHFNHPFFREGQLEIVQAILAGKDVVAILSTGHGKSTCFQVPVLVMKKTGIVISPLLSLAEDQIHDLEQCGIVAKQYNSSLSVEDKQELCRELLTHPFPLLYVTPESFQSAEFIAMLTKLHEKNQLGLLVVDEVHTVVEWGKDFRPSFLRLNIFRQTFPSIPIAAFTATADRASRNAICTTLGMHPAGSPKRLDVILPFDRPNITPIFVEGGADVLQDMKRWIEWYASEHDNVLPTCIAYCERRTDCDKMAEAFGKLMPDMNPAPYHAGMSKEDRNTTSAHWKSPYIVTKLSSTGVELEQKDLTHRILFATIAFGMGINMRSVRMVFQVSPPRNIYATLQQMGRGGRDGKQAYYIFYMNFGAIQKYMMFNDTDLREAKISKERHDEIEKQMKEMRFIMKKRTASKCRRAEMIGLLNGNEAAGLKCKEPFAFCDVCSPTLYPVLKKAIVKKNKKTPSAKSKTPIKKGIHK